MGRDALLHALGLPARGHLLAHEPADLRVYAIRRFFRIAPAYYVSLVVLFLFFAAHGWSSASRVRSSSLTNATFTHYLFPEYSSSLNVNGACGR